MLMKVKDWKIMENITREIFPLENANFANFFEKKCHWTRNTPVFGNPAGIGRKAA